MKHILTYKLFESEMVDNFDEKLKEGRDILFHNHEISKGYEIFTKIMQKNGIETLNNLNILYKKDKEKAISVLDNILNTWKKYSQSFKNIIIFGKQSDDWFQEKISKLENEKIDLHNKSQEYAKKTFDENFKVLLDECKRNYSLLKDKDIVKKLDELYNIIYQNYNSKKYMEAIDGASHLVITFFPNKKFFWKNEWTDQKLSNEKTLKILDEYKSQLNDSSSVVYKK